MLVAGGIVAGAIYLLVRPVFAQPTSNFQWNVGNVSGNIDWTPEYMEASYSVLKQQMGLDLSSPAIWNGLQNPLPVQIDVEDSINCSGGIGGSADSSKGILGFCAGNWNNNRWTYWILTHELTNLMTAVCVSNGWPDWWANGASPFPALSSVECMRTLGYYTEADAMEADFSANTVCYTMFRTLLDDFGWGLFQDLFQYLRTNQVNLTTTNSSFVVADTLQILAGRDLSLYFDMCSALPPPYPPYP